MSKIFVFPNKYKRKKNTKEKKNPKEKKIQKKKKYMRDEKSIKLKKILHAVRFELTRIASPDLKSGPLDHSGIHA